MGRLQRVYAHRGVSSLAPENTMGAFVKCLDVGAKWFECDVSMIADGSLVIMHDDTLERTTDGAGLLVEQTFSSLRRLDAGAWFSPTFRFERVPELATVIDLVNQSDLGVNLELKPCPQPAEFRKNLVLTVTRALQQLQDLAKVLVSSFDHELLREFARANPQIDTALLLDKGQNLLEVIELARKVECRSIHLGTRSLQPGLVRAIKEAGFVVAAWTVNDPLEAMQLAELGVDEVFSDYPQDLLHLVD